jgi:signal transduction histidine kinase
MIQYSKLRLVSLIVFLLFLFSACGKNADEPFGETLQKQSSFFELVNDPEARTPLLVGATALGFGILLLFILYLNKRYEGRKLEALVQERTAELNRYQRELEDALEDARAANASKSVFLANMSHEIRTPMNSIMGFSELALALDDEVSPKTRDYLAKIRTNTEWLLQIINDILDISKVESGKMELEHIPFDMHELFISCRTLIMPVFVNFTALERRFTST